MALIMVEGGQLSKEYVVSQLQRLYPRKWKWELVEMENNSFTTKFPSKIELQRAIAFGRGDVNVKDAAVLEGTRLKFRSSTRRRDFYHLKFG